MTQRSIGPRSTSSSCETRGTTPPRRDDFLAWASSVPRLANPADVIEWNTDKRYLGELAAAGLPVVPTTWLSPGDVVVLPGSGRHVLKPAVGAGSLDAAAFSMHDAHEAAVAQAHVARLLATHQTVMVQPYLDAIDEHGETGLIFIGGEFSHAVNKSAMLAHERELIGGLYKEESIEPSIPTAAELESGARALDAVPGGRSPSRLRPRRSGPRCQRRAGTDRARADRAVALHGPPHRARKRASRRRWRKN